MTYLERAMEIKEELIRNRRYLHERPEEGMELPETAAFVTERLKEMGYDPKPCGKSGVTALCGDPAGGVFLLRADMDALPMKEKSGLPFASARDCAHTCGHDMHTAMLLGAARLLKEREKELPGAVKFMFQPGEELLEGAKDMIAAGILENPKVDAAMACHMITGYPAGVIGYGKGAVSASSDHLRIRIFGKGGHGAHPQTAVDPINIGVHIHLALQELLSRECDPFEPAVLTFGKFHGGDAANIIPDSAVMEGTLRTYNEKVRERFLERIREICDLTARSFCGRAETEVLSSTCVLHVDGETAEAAASGWRKEKLFCMESGQKMSGSEDFAEVTARVPSAMFVVGAGTKEECRAGLHSPEILFNEDALPFGATAYAAGAAGWLERRKAAGKA